MSLLMPPLRFNPYLFGLIDKDDYAVDQRFTNTALNFGEVGTCPRERDDFKEKDCYNPVSSEFWLSEHSTRRAGGIMKPPGRGQEASQGRKPLVCSCFKPSPGRAAEDSYLIAICRPSGARLFLYPYRGLTPPAGCSPPFQGFLSHITPI
jgi:hypothetical protein